MANVETIASLTISVFTRHSVDCPKRNDPQWKRCDCRKSIYIREGGKTTYFSAMTRSWEQAERVAQAERDKRDPVQIELQKIAEREAAKAAKDALQLKPLGEALEQWLPSQSEVASMLRRSAINKRSGLLQEPMKRPGGFRRYPPDSVKRVRFIKRAQSLGFTLEEILGLLALDERKACWKHVGSRLTSWN